LARPRAQTRPAGPEEAAAFLAKAEEFLRAAQDSLELGNNTAAVGNAVHAGILAADAIAATRSRAVWRGEHAQALAHLEAAGEDGKQAAGTCAASSPSRLALSTTPLLCVLLMRARP
jgi:hypothetical protein